MSKKKSSPSIRRSTETASDTAYSHMQSRGPRDMGRTCDDGPHQIPSSTYRTLESAVPTSSLCTREEYNYNSRTGKGGFVNKPMGVMENARRSINSNRIPMVTTGRRQEREKRKGLDADQHDRLGYGIAPSPVAVTTGGKTKRGRY